MAEPNPEKQSGNQEQSPEEGRILLKGIADRNANSEKIEDMTTVLVVVDGNQAEVTPLSIDQTHLELDWEGTIFSVELERITGVALIEKTAQAALDSINTKADEADQQEVKKDEKISELKKKIENSLTREEITSLVKEHFEGKEALPFWGMDPKDYEEAKAGEEQYPGYTTPIDEILERLKKEGMKLTLGDHPESGNVFVLPAGSSDIAMDSIALRHLLITDEMPETLKKLVLAKKNA